MLLRYQASPSRTMASLNVLEYQFTTSCAFLFQIKRNKHSTLVDGDFIQLTATMDYLMYA